MAGEAAGARLDVWLWRARFLKTRSLAADFIARGAVRLARPGRAPQRVEKPSQTVQPGDILTFVLAGRARVVEVLAAGERRGPPAEARLLYAEQAGQASP
jgi:ribosome-associated heat shock protein Hsp15